MARLLLAVRRFVRAVVSTAIKLALVTVVTLVLWAWFANAYQHTPQAACAARPPIGFAAIEAKARGYQQPESSTYLTFPERYLVYHSAEYARALAAGPPSRFPYFRSIAQFWRGYYRVFKITQSKYGVKVGDHVVPLLIGIGFTADNAFKGIYESTIGRFTEGLSDGGKSEEDQFAARLAAQHSKALHERPSYGFAYGRALGELWATTPLRGANQARKAERRVLLSIEYGLKTVYGWLVAVAARSAYGAQPPQLHALALVGRSPELIPLPRNESFSVEVPALLRKGATIYEIAGNDEMFATALGPATWTGMASAGPLKTTGNWRVEFVEPLLSDPGVARIGLTVPVSCLGRALTDLEASGAKMEYLYYY